HIKNAIEDNLGGFVASSPYNQYFFVSGNEMVMRAHCAGALTSINAYPRCEFRQQINGDDTFWDYSDEHELNVTLKITNLPDLKQEVCVVQAKGTNTPSTTSGTKEVLRVEYRQDGSSGWHLEVNESSGPSNVLDYSLGQTVKIRVYINNDEVSLEMENLNTGDTYNLNFDSDYTHGYFKAGAYTQSSIWEEKNGVGDEDPDAFSEVRFSEFVLGASSNPPPPPSCTPQVPGGKSVNNIGETSANLSWNSVPDIDNYDLRYKAVNSNSWSYVTNYDPTNITLTGLSNNTQYEWQVKSVCPNGEDTNYAQGPGPNFTTDDDGGNPPGGCNLPWNGADYTVSNEVDSYSSGVIDISCVSNVCLKVDLEGVGNMEAADYVNIYYKINGGSQQALSLNTDSFSEKTEEICGLNGNTLEVIINAATSQGSEIYYISNLQINEDAGSGCNASVPSNRQVSNVTNASAVVSWNTNGADNYDVRYKKVVDTDWIYKNNNTGSNTTITNIVEETTYEWQVRSQCNGGGASSWSAGQGPDFTTDDNTSNGGSTFVPDPNKTYYIDAPYHNVRLASSGNSEDPYTTSINTTGDDVEWKFISKGNGFWHVQRAAGGSLPRLRTDNSPNADMQSTSFSGTYTYYTFEEGYINGSWFMTLPDGPNAYSRLQVNSSGQVKFISPSSALTWESFTFTEVLGNTNPPPTGNLALNKSAFQSTTAYGGIPSRAVDGNTDGNWGGGSVTHTSSNDNNDWWEVDLGGNYSLGDINIFNRTNSCCIWRLGDFTVIIKNSNGNIIWSQNINNVPNPSVTINAGGAFGRYVRIEQNLANAPLSLAEVEVYATSNASRIIFNSNSFENEDRNVAVYPNPFTNELMVKGVTENERIKVFNISGQMIFETMKSPLELGFLARGIYFLRIENGNPLKIIKN
ncbi:MAG: polysaccharide lyase family 7 protein, partial [Bacteroidota bacterium]